MREVMLILHFIGLAMGVGTSFGFMFLGMAASKMTGEERLKFQLNTMALSRMGHIGLTLLVISGGALMTPYWGSLTSSPVLMVKLILVLVLAGLVGYMTSIGKKARRGDAEVHLKKLAPLGMIALVLGLSIIVLAVTFFG